MNRDQALRWWRAGYQAGRQAAEHEHQAAARWDRLVASYHAQHAASQQAKLDTLLLETIAALASLFSKNNPSSPAPRPPAHPRQPRAGTPASNAAEPCADSVADNNAA